MGALSESRNESIALLSKHIMDWDAFIQFAAHHAWGYPYLALYLADTGKIETIRKKVLTSALRRALHSENDYDNETIQALLDHGADPFSLLAYAVSHENDTDVVEMMLERGARVDSRDEYGKSAMDYALRRGFAYLADLLAQYGAKLGLKEATLIGDCEEVEELLHEETWTKRTLNDALWIAVEQGYVNIVRVLLDHGADLHSERRSVYAYYCAFKPGEVNTFLFILHTKPDHKSIVPAMSLLQAAVFLNHLDVSRELLQQGAPLDPKRNTSLRKGQTEALARLKGREQIAELIAEYKQKGRAAIQLPLTEAELRLSVLNDSQS